MTNEVKIEKPSKEKLEELNVFSWATWECEPSVFNWTYNEQESFYVLEGLVTVKIVNKEKKEVCFGKGDLVTFPAGCSCEWNVIEKVKKHYTFDDIYK